MGKQRHSHHSVLQCVRIPGETATSLSVLGNRNEQSPCGQLCRVASLGKEGCAQEHNTQGGGFPRQAWRLPQDLNRGRACPSRSVARAQMHTQPRLASVFPGRGLCAMVPYKHPPLCFIPDSQRMVFIRAQYGFHSMQRRLAYRALTGELLGDVKRGHSRK